MKYVKFSNTDITVSTLSFGCWELGGTQWELTSDETNLQVLRTAFDQGITSFDTAEGYGGGHSEEIVGQALRGHRHQCFLASKVSPLNLRAADVRRSIEASLKRLGTDYLDLYYIHWPNEEIPIEETIAEFNKLKKEGLIRATGVSNFNLEQLKKASGLGRIDAVQSEYSLLQRNIEDGILQYCVENSISFFSYSSLAKGILTGAYHLGKATLKETDFRVNRRLFLNEHLEKETELILLLKEIADSKGTTLANLALSWLLHQKGQTSAIVGTQSEKHLLDNLSAVDILLNDEDISRLNQVSARVIASIQ